MKVLGGILLVAGCILGCSAGLTEEDVRSVVREEIATAVESVKIGAQGPPGMQGPAGEQGQVGCTRFGGPARQDWSSRTRRARKARLVFKDPQGLKVLQENGDWLGRKAPEGRGGPSGLQDFEDRKGNGGPRAQQGPWGHAGFKGPSA